MIVPGLSVSRLSGALGAAHEPRAAGAQHAVKCLTSLSQPTSTRRVAHVRPAAGTPSV